MVRPAPQHRDLAVGKDALVAEGVRTGLGVPGRHHAILADGGDHLGAAPGLLIRRERERADVAGAVAVHALRREDRRDVARVGDLVRFLGGRVPRFEDAPDRRLVSARGITPGGRGLDRRFQIVGADPRARPADGGELIVDAPAVGHPIARVDHERLRNVRRLEPCGDLAGRVEEDREADLVLLAVLESFRPREARIGEHAEEVDLELAGSLRDLTEPREIPIRDRAFGVEEDERDRANAVLGAGPANLAVEIERADVLHARGFDGLRRRCDGHEQEQRQKDGAVADGGSHDWSPLFFFVVRPGLPDGATLDPAAGSGPIPERSVRKTSVAASLRAIDPSRTAVHAV